MNQEAEVFLTAGKVERLAKSLPFSPRQKTTFNQRKERFNDATTLLEGLVADFADQFTQTAAAIDPFIAQVAEANSSFKTVETTVAQDNSSAIGILRRVRHEAIGNPRFNPPWLLKPLKALAISEPDPRVAVEINAQQAAQRKLTEKARQVNTELEGIKGTQIPKIDGAAFCVDDATANLLATCRRVAIASSSAVVDFVTIVPEQAIPTALAYADEQYGSVEELAHFQDFVDMVYTLFKPGEAIPNYKVAPEKFPVLDPKVQSCWKAYVGFRTLQQLANRGIIEQPKQPEIFNRLGALLPL